MTCGSTQRGIVMPIPTIKYNLGNQAPVFDLEAIHTHIKTPHKNVEKLLREAIVIFLQDLQLLQKDLDLNENAAQSSTDPLYGSSRARRNAEGNEEGLRSASGGYFNYDNNKCKLKHCDIDTLNIRLVVERSDEVYLTLDSDERYNLSITRE